MHLVIYLVSLPFQCCPTLANRIYALLSHITALRFPLVQQLSPQADHLPWRLIMCSIIIINAPKLTKLQAMHVLHRPGAVELFYPHSHAHVLHLKQLQWVYVRIIFMFSFPDRTGKREREVRNISQSRSRIFTLSLCFSNSETMYSAMSNEMT